ncbi:nitroreductase [Desulfocucumis palustris]|uniref:Nitroreductase n=1 Tax=Desulfocucumis palustris TaxID=1898651 RepID=A0A2L2XEB5_9FIRM|nr:nitroreductase family protein [Desulfocucumis palustris]GBF34709.1 nitroreductase [Desulfocucumis palustris]
MNALEAIKARKSTRRYKPNAVEAEKIEQLISAANNAPKAGTFHISVVENQAVLKSLNDAALTSMKNSGNDFLMSRAALDGYQPLYGAPVLFLLSAPEGAPYNQANVSCAAANMTVAATALGLGSCYVIAPLLGLQAKPELVGKIGIPQGFVPVCGVLTGYSDGNAFETAKSTGNNVNYCK